MAVASTQKANITQKKFLKYICLYLCVCCFSTSFAQLSTTINSNANQLVQNLLGPGLTYSNATLNCYSNGAGTFTYVPDVSLSFTTGVVLTTGHINGSGGILGGSALNTAASNGFSYDAGRSGDAQLNTLQSNSGHDACVLEFDFLPLGDTVKFNYVFGSEEYPTYVCSEYNDVFGFFVSGPNPVGGTYTNQNIAIIPGTTNVPVAINTVHPNAWGDNTSTGKCSGYTYDNYATYFYNNSSSSKIALNGLTKKMTAMIAVIPCSTYHMKLGVEDAGDGVLDSGVFLEGGSLSSNSVAISAVTARGRRAGVPPVNNVGEGCDTGYVNFKINPRLVDVTVHFTIGGTATNGVDYETIVDSVVIPAGDTMTSLPIIPIPDGLVEGTETVKMYIAGVCSSAPLDSITVNIIDALQISLGSDQTVCRDSSLVLYSTASGGSGNYDYLWTPAAPLSSPTVPNPVATLTDTTVFVLTLSDSVNCSVSDTIKIRVRDCNGLYLTVDKDIVCPGQQVQLQASLWRAGFAQWTPNSGLNMVSDATIQNPTAVVNGRQTFYYSVTQLDGSVLTDSITVDIDTTARVVAGGDTTQCSNAIILDATPSGNQASPYQYTWTRLSDGVVVSTAQTTNFTQSTWGPETYVVTLEGGYCVVSDSVTIAVYPVSNTTLTINMCPQQLPYTWNGQSITTSGTYIFDTTNVYGCDSSVTLTFNVVNVIVDSQAVVLCYYQQNTYTWGGQVLSNSGVYRDTFVNAYGCDSIAILNLIIDSLTFTAPTQTDILCYGATTGSISSTAINGTGTNYVWTHDGSPITPNSPTAPTNLAAGNYRQIAVDANGCRDTADFVLTQPSQITFVNTTITNVSCNGYNDGRIVSSATGGVPGYTYSWSHNPLLNGTTADTLLAGPYTQIVTDANNCTVSQTLTVTQPSALQLSLNATIDPCSHSASGKIVSNVAGGTPVYQYVLMQNSTVLQANSSGLFSLLEAGDYSVSITDSRGCSTSQNVLVPARIPDMFNVTTEQTSCFGSEYRDGRILISPLSTNNPYRYSIDNGASFTSDSILANLAAGYYTVTARNRYGCDTVFTVQITQPPVSIAVINPNDTTIQLGDGLVLTATLEPSQSNVTSYHWSPSEGLSCDDCPNPIFSSYQKHNDYSLTITYNNLCEAITTASISVVGEGTFYIPNAFSPNGDGNNDEFVIFGKGLLRAYVKIFNRWGEKVFDSMESPFANWDGTYKGVAQPSMVYVYEAEIEFLNGKKKRQMGSLMLIR